MTIKDYNIKENNIIAMVRNSSLINSTSISYDELDTQETDPLKTDKDNDQLYHLVKPEDENNQNDRNSIVNYSNLNQVTNGEFPIWKFQSWVFYRDPILSRKTEMFERPKLFCNNLAKGLRCVMDPETGSYRKTGSNPKNSDKGQIIR